MKAILFLLFLPIGASAQYLKLEAQFANTAAYSPTGGAALSAGGMTKAGVYFGAGFLFLHDESPYVPIFFETGFSANDKVLFPSANFRIGYSVSESQPFDGKYGDAGFYIDGRIALAYRPGLKGIRILPFFGYSNVSVTGGSVGYVNYGLSIMFAKTKK